MVKVSQVSSQIFVSISPSYITLDPPADHRHNVKTHAKSSQHNTGSSGFHHHEGSAVKHSAAACHSTQSEPELLPLNQSRLTLLSF